MVRFNRQTSDPAAPAAVTLYTAHAAQQPIHASPARFRIVTSGRRFGKTMLAVNEVAFHCLSKRKLHTAWIAPSYQQTKIAFRWIQREFVEVLKRGGVSVSELRMEWRNGSVTQFRTAENADAIRGEAFDFVVGDEFASWPREAWEAAVRPTLADTQGGALLVGTPKGRGLFYELWLRGQDPHAWPEYASWQCPTSSNPFIPPEEIAEARRSLPHDVFAQEYLAAWLDDAAGVFRHVDACETGTLEDPVPHAEYLIGWDPAKHADASVVTVLEVQRRHVVAWERWLEVDYTVQMERVAALAHRYHNAAVLMDSTGVGDPLLESLQSKGVDVEGFNFSNKTKQQLVEHLAVQIEQRTITFPPLPVLRGELAAFQYEITRAGNVHYSAPVGMHDDAVMSLALAVWAARTAGGVVQGFGLAETGHSEARQKMRY